MFLSVIIYYFKVVHKNVDTFGKFGEIEKRKSFDTRSHF